MNAGKQSSHFVLCLRNGGYPASLEPRKIYRVLQDADAMEHDLLRVIDESGADYLYPSSLFAPIELPKSVDQSELFAR